MSRPSDFDIPTRKGDWMETFTGRKFWPLDPHPEEVCLEDIAWSLSNICRFGGHSTSFYSVAQHSVLVAKTILTRSSATSARSGLFHDSAEAYLGDIIRPIKPFLTQMHDWEKNVLVAIGEALSVELVPMPSVVKVVDNILLATERRDLMTQGPHWGSLDQQPLDERIFPLPPSEAFKLFMKTYSELEALR